METNKKLARLYGKLGMSTDPELIEGRVKCVDEAAKKLKVGGVYDLTRCILGLKISEEPSFIAALSEADPSLDLSPNDKETSVLACAIANKVLCAGGNVAEVLSLVLVSACFGGKRQPQFDIDILDLALGTLTDCQGIEISAPDERKSNPQPKSLTTAIQEFSTNKADYSNANTPMATALTELGKYAENNAQAAARSDNDILRYFRRVEEEARVQWWVMGGWSHSANKPFRELDLTEAALRAALELSEKHSTSLGLFAAPALFDMITTKDRTDKDQSIETVLTVATKLPFEWRLNKFKEYANSTNVGLLPLISAMGIAALDEDAADWAPRFQRLAQIDPAMELDTRQISLQLYRELLVLRAL